MECMDIEKINFYETKSGFTALIYNGIDYGRVEVLRMLPLKYENEYLCIRKDKERRTDITEEIGILRSIADLPSAQQKIVNNELKRRYFTPEVLEVFSVKEEFGYSMWNVNTTAGKREFTVMDMDKNLLSMGENKVIMTDVCGNRFLFKDITVFGEKVMKIVEIWL